VKFIVEQATKAQRGVVVKFYFFLNLGARWGGWSTQQRRRFTPRKGQVPIVQEAERAPGTVWMGTKILPPPLPTLGFDPRTVQPVASTLSQPTLIREWQF
jgi:hypothetical protein